MVDIVAVEVVKTDVVEVIRAVLVRVDVVVASLILRHEQALEIRDAAYWRI